MPPRFGGRFKQARFWRDWTRHHDSAGWDRLLKVSKQEQVSERVAWNGYATLIRLCIHHGIGLHDITAEHILDFRTRLSASRRPGRDLCSLWHHAKLAGLLRDAPDSLDALLLRGQRTPTELVDRYGVTDPAIRRLLIDYVTEMSTTSDYGSLDNTSRVLVNLFWRDLQDHHPGLGTIALTPEQAAGWKQRIQTKPDGTARRNAYSVLGAVRSFYLDIAAWAHEEPARWGPWAVPCPVSVRDVRGYKAQRRRTTEGMQGRTRTLAPLMPRFSDFARGRHRRAVELLDRARAAKAGETFTLHDQHYTRLTLSLGANASAIRLSTPGETKRVDPVWQEIQRFWAWAAIETLRHSGIRIEEMLELTHLSIRQFRKPDGQILPLLQVAPSKNDQERILPASPELTAVLARIVARLTDSTTTIPLAVKRDEHELVHSPPMPYLFQHRESGRSPGHEQRHHPPLPQRDRQRHGLARCRRPALEVHSPRLPAAVHHRPGQPGLPDPPRRTDRRARLHRNHPRLHRRLPERRLPGLRQVHRHAAHLASFSRIPGPHPGRMDGVPRALPAPQGVPG